MVNNKPGNQQVTFASVTFKYMKRASASGSPGVRELTTVCPQAVPAELQGRCTRTDRRRDLGFPEGRRHRR